MFFEISKFARNQISGCRKPPQHANEVRHVTVGHRCHLASNVDELDLD